MLEDIKTRREIIDKVDFASSRAPVLSGHEMFIPTCLHVYASSDRHTPTQVDEGAKKLMDDVNAKMVEWEGKLVALGNAMDKAKALQVSSHFTFHLPRSRHGRIACRRVESW